MLHFNDFNIFNAKIYYYLTMKYKKLGDTEIDVSIICLGTMTWGEQNTEKEGFAQMDIALERGVNFFDTAELYSVPPKKDTFGSTESIIGNWFESRGSRDQVVLATKVVGRSGINSKSLTIDVLKLFVSFNLLLPDEKKFNDPFKFSKFKLLEKS